jgi:hypothetical protein
MHALVSYGHALSRPRHTGAGGAPVPSRGAQCCVHLCKNPEERSILLPLPFYQATREPKTEREILMEMQKLESKLKHLEASGTVFTATLIVVQKVIANILSGL